MKKKYKITSITILILSLITSVIIGGYYLFHNPKDNHLTTLINKQAKDYNKNIKTVNNCQLKIDYKKSVYATKTPDNIQSISFNETGKFQLTNNADFDANNFITLNKNIANNFNSILNKYDSYADAWNSSYNAYGVRISFNIKKVDIYTTGNKSIPNSLSSRVMNYLVVYDYKKISTADKSIHSYWVQIFADMENSTSQLEKSCW